MVQAKFGMPAVAGRQMEVISTAILLATQSPPSSPRKPEWRAHMERMSAISCEAYRDVRACPLKSNLSAGNLRDEGVS
jgi:phosphoenolpyruvate carboxylase